MFCNDPGDVAWAPLGCEPKILEIVHSGDTQAPDASGHDDDEEEEEGERSASVKNKDKYLIREIAMNRQLGAEGSPKAKEASERLSEHVSKSGEMRKGWCGLGLKLSSSAPYRVLKASKTRATAIVAKPSSQQGELRSAIDDFDTLLAVDDIDITHLKLQEVQILIVGPPGSCLTLTLALQDTPGVKDVLHVSVMRVDHSQPSQPERPDICSVFGLHVVSVRKEQLISSEQPEVTSQQSPACS